jgi:hypothetical protein
MLFTNLFATASSDTFDNDTTSSEIIIPISFADVQALQTKGYLITLAPFGRLCAHRRIATLSDRN